MIPSSFLAASSMSASLPSFAATDLLLDFDLAGFLRGPRKGLSSEGSTSGSRFWASVKTAMSDSFGSSSLNKVKRDLRCLRGEGMTSSRFAGLKERARVAGMAKAGARLLGVLEGVGSNGSGERVLCGGWMSEGREGLCEGKRERRTDEGRTGVDAKD